jgi:hypothetical protein
MYRVIGLFLINSFLDLKKLFVTPKVNSKIN